MYKVIIDGKEAGKYVRVSYAKKIADESLNCGAFYAEIFRGKQLYCFKHFNKKWHNVWS